jgi:hypothetical protein
MRASHADRDHVVALLREHLAAGRLTADEFKERMDLALAARTFGDLAPLLADLPGLDPGRVALAGAAGLAASPSPSRREADRWTLRLSVSGAVLAAYFVCGLAFGIWWLPWFAIVVPVLLIRHMRYR